jgi:radical SAM protein with 4Fe4S-binding SPASM domain
VGSLSREVSRKALERGAPFNVQLDITYRCNERCVHCYLDHDDHGEMTTAEIRDVLDQLAAAGAFSLSISGGEILLRKDFFDILEHARSLMFSVRLKTNAILIGEEEARRIRDLGVQQVQISIYSHRAEVHDGITKVRGSLARSVRAIRFLKSQGLRVIIANVLMRQNACDYPGVQALAAELGVGITIDPTITPKMDGDHSIVAMRIPGAALKQVFNDESVVGDVEQFCAPPAAAGEKELNGYSCSAGHTACYISPYGDVYPCVQFPLPCGNLRRQRFEDIWRNSEALKEVRSIRVRDLPTCSGCSHVAGCTRCPGLAWQEGNMRGPSTADCEKSYTRTGIPSANMIAKAARAESAFPFQTASPPALTQTLAELVRITPAA